MKVAKKRTPIRVRKTIAKQGDLILSGMIRKCFRSCGILDLNLRLSNLEALARRQDAKTPRQKTKQPVGTPNHSPRSSADGHMVDRDADNQEGDSHPELAGTNAATEEPDGEDVDEVPRSGGGEDVDIETSDKLVLHKITSQIPAKKKRQVARNIRSALSNIGWIVHPLKMR